MTHRNVKLALSLLLALAAGCTTMATGFGTSIDATLPTGHS
jgi:hypothetical protein